MSMSPEQFGDFSLRLGALQMSVSFIRSVEAPKADGSLSET